jgi:hypothetical protein
VVKTLIDAEYLKIIIELKQRWNRSSHLSASDPIKMTCPNMIIFTLKNKRILRLKSLNRLTLMIRKKKISPRTRSKQRQKLYNNKHKKSAKKKKRRCHQSTTLKMDFESLTIINMNF